MTSLRHLRQPWSRRGWRSFERLRYHHPTFLEVEVVVAHVSEVVEQRYLRHLEKTSGTPRAAKSTEREPPSVNCCNIERRATDGHRTWARDINSKGGRTPAAVTSSAAAPSCIASPNGASAGRCPAKIAAGYMAALVQVRERPTVRPKPLWQCARGDRGGLKRRGQRRRPA